MNQKEAKESLQALQSQQNHVNQHRSILQQQLGQSNALSSGSIISTTTNSGLSGALGGYTYQYTNAYTWEQSEINRLNKKLDRLESLLLQEMLENGKTLEVISYLKDKVDNPSA